MCVLPAPAASESPLQVARKSLCVWTASARMVLWRVVLARGTNPTRRGRNSVNSENLFKLISTSPPLHVTDCPVTKFRKLKFRVPPRHAVPSVARGTAWRRAPDGRRTGAEETMAGGEAVAGAATAGDTRRSFVFSACFVKRWYPTRSICGLIFVHKRGVRAACNTHRIC